MEQIQLLQNAINYIKEHLLESINYKDIAYKYGYETLESFSKAFSRFFCELPIIHFKTGILNLVTVELSFICEIC
ncbi:hypothetical protein [Anaerorhabdus furcosa]|uniref:HTH araC/xylS-type domain-containing protein n=1 Tax=Anaerorhabdus furcosa TaxID=118967 RepID=A0A1T4P1N8_9FIRM|nr:hypothetical protein [Anaerorhabdus furcosa]SJZ85196.1 hypothetical protein SAMN02745191_1829 [Anaerorhabdus furcosa]